MTHAQPPFSNLNPTRQVTVAVIGAGSAGQVAFKQILATTQDCVIISDHFWTTTCATVGCMPSKVLIACAERAYHARHSQDFSVQAKVNIDGAHVMQHVRQERDRFAGFVQTQVDSWLDNQKIDGKAKIMGKNADGDILIAVNNDVIACKNLIIATGATPTIPDAWRDTLGDRLLTSDTVFELPDLPKSLAVIGSGAIGLELAQAMARLGVTVTLFNRSEKIAGLSDPAVNQAAIDSLTSLPVNEFYPATHLKKTNKSADPQLQDDFTLQLNSKINTITPQRNATGELTGITICFEDKTGHAHQADYSYVLVAMGRETQLDRLGVANIGIQLDEKNRPNELNPVTGQIGDLPVYVVGDANAFMPLMHVASFQGKQAGNQVVNDINQRIKKSRQSKQSTQSTQAAQLPVNLGIVFCQPQIAQVGQNYATLKKQNAAQKDDLLIGEVSFANQGRSRVMGENQGLLRIYADKKGTILGASMVAPDAEYMAHLLALAIMQQMTVTQMLAMPFYHPTVLEGLRTALQQVQKQL